MEKNISLENSVQFLFFIIDNERYCIDAKYVQEIVDYINITNVPKSNKAIKGVTNIRGELIPVVDPKVRFKDEEIEVKKRTAFVILQIMNYKKSKTTPIALMVDLVIEVQDIKEIDILEAPQFGTTIDHKYISNIIRYDEEYISVLNIENLLDITELSKPSE